MGRLLVPSVTQSHQQGQAHLNSVVVTEPRAEAEVEAVGEAVAAAAEAATEATGVGGVTDGAGVIAAAVDEEEEVAVAVDDGVDGVKTADGAEAAIAVVAAEDFGAGVEVAALCPSATMKLQFGSRCTCPMVKVPLGSHRGMVVAAAIHALVQLHLVTALNRGSKALMGVVVQCSNIRKRSKKNSAIFRRLLPFLIRMGTRQVS